MKISLIILLSIILSIDSIEPDYIYIDLPQNLVNVNLQTIINSNISVPYFYAKYSIPKSPKTISTHFIDIQFSSIYYDIKICTSQKDKISYYNLKYNINKYALSESTYVERQEGDIICYQRQEYISDELDNELKPLSPLGKYIKSFYKNSSIIMTSSLDYLLYTPLKKEYIDKISEIYKQFTIKFVYDYDQKLDKFTIKNYYIIYGNRNNMYNIDNLNKYKLIFVKKGYKYYAIKGTNINEIKEIKKETYSLIDNIKTLHSDSIFHNTMTIQLNKNQINSLFSHLSSLSLCLHFTHILTENIYIEKNEFLLNLNQISNNKKFIASDFIELELSSELSPQSYYSLTICGDKQYFRNLNYSFSFPIHFRYQPPINSLSDVEKQKVIMSLPSLLLFEEGKKKLNDNTWIINYYNHINNIIEKDKKGRIEEIELIEGDIMFIDNLNQNYIELLNEIPAGQKKYFWQICFLTNNVLGISVLIILYGLYTYIKKQ